MNDKLKELLYDLLRERSSQKQLEMLESIVPERIFMVSDMMTPGTYRCYLKIDDAVKWADGYFKKYNYDHTAITVSAGDPATGRPAYMCGKHYYTWNNQEVGRITDTFLM